MGGTTWSASDAASYAKVSHTATTARSVHEVYTSRSIHKDLDPKYIRVRESRNSIGNLKSTPIILGSDITGSMGEVARLIVAETLGTIIEGIFSRNPVTDPHIAVAGIGDALFDSAPLQITQFETDIKMVEQLLKIWVEGGGGGNGIESYNLAWHFAATKTSCDAFEKDGRKGFLFTWGDEKAPGDLTKQELDNTYGPDNYVSMTNQQLLENLQDKYHVFHIILENVGASHRPGTRESWQAVLGERVLRLDDYRNLGELIVSTMQVVAGDDLHSVASSWGDKSSSISRALATYSTGQIAEVKQGGIVRL